MSTRITEAASLAEARANLYVFLVEQWLSSPADGACAGGLADRWRAAAAVLEGCGAEVVVELLASAPDSGERLEREFQELLRIPAGRYVAPMRSVYWGAASGEEWVPGRKRGRPWFEALRAYRRAGDWQPPDPEVELDHIGCLLSFAAALCRQEAESWSSGDAERAREIRWRHRRFIDEQLADWLPALVERLDQVSELPYYPALARMTSAYLRAEGAYLRQSEG